jgi:signal peptidase
MQTFIQKIGTLLIILVCLVAIFAIGAFLPKVLPVEEWANGWYTFRVVSSGSMEPEIGVGSLVVTWPTENYTEGDVVTFGDRRSTEAPTTHRITQKKQEDDETRFVTKGEANEERDLGTIGKEEILGEVFLTIPYAGYLSVYARSPGGSAVLIVGVIVIFVLWSSLESFCKKRQRKKNGDGTFESESASDSASGSGNDD